jgi:hypothetical protein
MPNFDDMFDRLSGESDKRKQEAEEKARREREEREAEFEAARSILDNKALPALQEAKRNFEARGVQVTIENNWTNGRGMFPRYEFRCEGDYRPNKVGGKYKPQGRYAFFSVKHGELEVGLSREGGSRALEEQLHGGSESMIEQAIQESLASYFRSIEQGERPL